MDWDIFFDIHKDLPREGSGREEYTLKAFEMIPAIKNPRILDIGCGPGLPTIQLAKLTDGEVIGIKRLRFGAQAVKILVVQDSYSNCKICWS